MLSSARGGIIAGFGLLIAILVTVATGGNLAFWFPVTASAAGTVLGLAAALLIAGIILRQSPSPEPAVLAVAGREMGEERERTLAQLRESETKFRGLLESAPDAVVIVDADGRIVLVNTQTEKMFGYNRDELLGEPVEMLMPERSREAHVGLRTGYYAEPRTRPMGAGRELTGRRKDGSEFPVDISLSTLETEDGVLVTSVIRDISERKRAEEALRESEEKVRLLLHSTGEAIYGLDLQGNCTFCNPACLRLLGYDNVNDLHEQNMHDLIHHTRPDGSHYPNEECRICQAFREGKGTHVDDEVLWRADGTSFPAEYWSYPISRDDRIIGSVVTFVDISERKQAEATLRESEERLMILFEYAPDAYFLVDLQGNLVDLNRAAEEITGLSKKEVIGKNYIDLDLLPPEDIPKAEAILAKSIAGKPAGPTELTLNHRNGGSTAVEVRTFLVEINGQALVLAVDRDITERKRAEEALRESEEHFRSLIENASDIITTMDGDGAISYASPSIQRVLGYKPEDLIGKNAFDFIHPDDLPDVLDSFSRLLQDAGTPQSGQFSSVEFRFRHADGSWRTLEAIGRNVLNDPGSAGLVINSRDVSERKQAEETIRHLAYHDALTDLPNRALLDDRLTQALAQAGRSKQKPAVLSLDLDRFKVINDSLGHAAGDQVLRAVGERLTGLVREGDTVARVGGDEFIMLLGTARAEEAAKIAERILEALRPPFDIDGQELHATASIGISLYPYDGEDAATLLKNADAAMYRAKEQGRDNYQFYTSATNAKAFQRLALENSLRQAVEHAELVVYYQPQADVDTGQVVGVEALVRWQHPDWGLIAPSQFIPLAEETGLIVPLGEWVLRTACAQNQAWQEAGLPPLRLAVNLSARQFQQPDLVETIARVLKETGLDPHCLELEITEGAAMQNVHLTTKVLHDLREMGVRIAIDDFGTGYSSLSYLKDFPIHTLKIDQSFVRDVIASRSDAAIVTAIIAMAHSLDLKVIAEGVETKHQLTFLRERGCDEFQGYLLARPMPALAFEAIVKQHERSRGQAESKVM